MSPRAQFWVVTLAAVLSAGVTARLGVWQLDRAAQKTAMQRSIDERGRVPALPASQLAWDAGRAPEQWHRRIVLQGRWSARHTIYLDNRQMNGHPGFYVVTPLVLGDGRAVLVQRGWAPRDPRDRLHLPVLPADEGLVEVHGRIAPPPARVFEFDAAASGPIRQNLVLDAHARETGLTLAPLSVLQDDVAGDGLLRQWPRPALDVQKNYGYAFQWFAISALITILYVWFQLIRPRRIRKS
jgi:surfeit locus 1 family protein